MQLDISMKDEYEKASKLLRSTEQLWETLQTEDFEALPTNDPTASQARPKQAETLEEQIMRDMMGDAGGPGTAAASPSSSIPSNAKMSLYDQMDAMLGSISAGSFSSPTSNTAQSPSSPSPAAPLPPLRAPNRGQQSPQQQPDRPTARQPAQQQAAAKPPPQLSSRPALGAASARDDSDEDELSAAELERRAVELEEELFPGLAGQDALLEADAVTVARERLQAVKSGKADIGGGTMEGATLEERFPDLEAEGVTMEDLLAASKAQPRCGRRPSASDRFGSSEAAVSGPHVCGSSGRRSCLISCRTSAFRRVIHVVVGLNCHCSWPMWLCTVRLVVYSVGHVQGRRSEAAATSTAAGPTAAKACVATTGAATPKADRGGRPCSRLFRRPRSKV